jgi:hypothetical protein
MGPNDLTPQIKGTTLQQRLQAFCRAFIKSAQAAGANAEWAGTQTGLSNEYCKTMEGATEKGQGAGGQHS